MPKLLTRIDKIFKTTGDSYGNIRSQVKLKESGPYNMFFMEVGQQSIIIIRRNVQWYLNSLFLFNTL